MLNVFFTVASVHHTVKFTLLSESCVHLILMVRMPIFFFLQDVAALRKITIITAYFV